MRHWQTWDVQPITPEDSFRRMVVQTDAMRAGLLGYAAGATVGEHAHLESGEVFYVVAGTASFEIEGAVVSAHEGDLIHVAAGERHQIRVGIEPLVLFAVVAPNLDDAWIAAESPARRRGDV